MINLHESMEWGQDQLKTPGSAIRLAKNCATGPCPGSYICQHLRDFDINHIGCLNTQNIHDDKSSNRDLHLFMLSLCVVSHAYLNREFTNIYKYAINTKVSYADPHVLTNSLTSV